MIEHHVWFFTTCFKSTVKYLIHLGVAYVNGRRNTFAPSFKFVKQTITVTSSCEIKVQKSAIVFGLGPVWMKMMDDYMIGVFLSPTKLRFQFNDIHLNMI